ncbi:HET-domain-containing protein [Agrocybe pediades]|nr:HET-domain-containing protein [Agrocybe pediades]
MSHPLAASDGVDDLDINSSATPHKVCNTCQALVIAAQEHLTGNSPHLPLRDSPIIAQYIVPDLQRSGFIEGCHLCSIISQALCPAHSEKDILSSSNRIVTVKISDYGKRASWHGTDTNLAFLDVWLKENDGRRIRNTNVPIVSNSHGFLHSPVPASWSLSTASDATFDLARSWLSECCAQHELCEEVRATPVSSLTSSAYPDYLISIGEDGRACHLCATSTLDSGTRPAYVALSHRWGASRPFTLTSKSLASLLESIPVTLLPKTFQDALLITHRLGHSYIWIDSLCIMQDSKEHWEKESAIMGDIYRASACTISALGATDGDSGTFAFDETYRSFWKFWTSILYGRYIVRKINGPFLESIPLFSEFTCISQVQLPFSEVLQLVALHGIINLVETRKGLHNIAGLWKEYLLPELLWFRDTPCVARPVGVYQAPTWSWACLNAEVAVGLQDFNYAFEWKAEVLEAAAQGVLANGQISSAYIRIRGPLVKVTWVFDEDGERYRLRWGDVEPEENSADDRVYFLPDVQPATGANNGSEAWALHIVKATSENSYMNMGIVVAKEYEGPHSENRTYVRIGSFKQYDWPSNPTTFFEDGRAQMVTLVVV